MRARVRRPDSAPKHLSLHGGGGMRFLRSRSGGRALKLEVQSGRPEGLRTCRDCHVEDQHRHDLATLMGYVRTYGHVRCIVHRMTEDTSPGSQLYREQVLRAFDEALADINEIIREQKELGILRVVFEAMRMRKEILSAKAKALGMGVGERGRPVRNKDREAAEEALGERDVSGMVEGFLRERGMMPVSSTGEIDDDGDADTDDEDAEIDDNG